MRNTKLRIRSCGFGLACLLALLGTPSVARAQGVGAAAGIKGIVTDASGSVMAKATVVAEDAGKGIQRSAVTDSSGEYRFTGLPPATYNLTVALPGFQTQIQKGLVVTVGQMAIVDFHLKVASRKEIVEVSAEPPAVDTERSSQADTLTQAYIQGLPIDRRDYLTFTLLAPGVSNSTRLADDTSYRVKQTPTSGLSFYGSNGRGNSVTVDGGEANDDQGGVRLTLSQDAVQEFQINRSNYTAEMGGASGATINIVSRSGSNNMHGSLYGFFRNDAMDARDPFAFSSALAPDPTFANFDTTSLGAPIKNSLSRQQYGGAIGFPIVKDKTFLYGSFEGLRQDSQNSVPLLTDSSIFAGPSAAATSNPFLPGDPRHDQQAIVSALAVSTDPNPVPCLANPAGGYIFEIAPVCAFLLQQGLAVTPGAGLSLTQNGLNRFLIGQFENNSGVFPYNTRQYLGSGRLDHRFSANDQTYLRYNYGHDLEESPDVQSLTAYSRGSSIHAYNHTLVGAWFHLFSPTTQNEARVQWSYNSANVIPNEPAEVGIDLPAFGQFGTNIFLPQHEILRRYEFADNLSLTRGHHTLRFGGAELIRGNHTATNIFFPGRFEFGPLPGGLVSPCLAPLALGNFCGVNTAGGAAINSLQNASLGLPIFLQDGFGIPGYSRTRPFTALYAQDAWAIASNFTLNYGVRYELDTQYAPLNTPKHNFAPRVSFAWDPRKDHKTVVRAGYGIFYSQIYNAIPGVDLALGVVNKNNTAVENQGPGGPGSQVANLTATCGFQEFGSVIIPGNGSSPCNRQIGIYVDPINLPTPFNSATVYTNLFNQGNNGTNGGKLGCTTPAPGDYACITPADLTAASNGFFVPTNSNEIPALSVIFSNERDYKSAYSQQAGFGIEQQVAPGFTVSLSYIYSHTVHLPVAIDTNLQDPGTVSVPLANGKTVTYRNWNSSAAFDPLGQTTAKCDPTKGGSPFNCFYNPLIIQNNQYTSAGSALYHGGIVEVKKQFKQGISVLGSYTYSKAFDTTTDFNSDYGPQDNLNMAGEHSLSNFDQRHKVVIAGVFGVPWEKGILSGFEVAPIFNYNSGHPFNLLSGEATNGDNHPTNGRPIGAARNTGLGPNYVDFDVRFSWRHKLGEKTTLQIVAEGFNLANRTNYASVNNQVGPLFGLDPTFTTFNVEGIRPNGTTVTPSTPLSFTSAFPKRQIQLGLRLTF